MADLSTTTAQPLSAGWLKNARFDGGFILGITVLALIAGATAVAMPRLFPVILLLDLWLLGYHHVISTYTRLCFDKQSFQQHKFLVLYLPFIVFGATLAVAAGVGLWAIASIYLYWQWFHYTRQSWGVSQMYNRKAGFKEPLPDRALSAAFWAVPLWGILYRSHQDPGTFLGLELRVVPIPEIAVTVSGIAAAALVGWFTISRIQMARAGQLPLAHTLYWASHVTVFSVSYLLIENITFGWLVVNIWHNLQYIVFVWLYNTKRFEGGVTQQAPFLSRLSQPGSWKRYMLLCLALSTIVYAGVDFVGSDLGLIAIPLIVIYQAANFHHYIVDGIIWKSRKNKVQRTLSSAG